MPLSDRRLLVAPDAQDAPEAAGEPDAPVQNRKRSRSGGVKTLANLELAADKDRRTPSTRESTRVRYVKTLERMLLRTFPDWKADGFRTAMDLEKSFGPAYARGVLVRGTQAWAVIGVNPEESQAITLALGRPAAD